MGGCIYFFIQNKEGKNIATSSIWDGNHFGKTLQRIHWVAVSREYQGLGLAKCLVSLALEKCLVSLALDTFNELGFKDYIYLTSQVSSYKALNIYSKFGFEPYFGEMPKNWGSSKEDFEKDTKYAWKLIHNLSKDN